MTSSYSVSCDDSPLSTTGSVLAILTFVYALLVSTALYLRSGHRANKDTYAIFERFTDDIVDQSIEIQAFTSEHSCTTFRHEDRILQRRMQQILRRAEKSLQVLQDYAGKHRLDFKSDPRWFEKEIIGRAKFVVSFDKINSIRRELGELRNEIRILDLQISIRHQQRLVLEQLDLLRREITPSGMYQLEAQDEDTRMERLKMVVT